MAGTVRNNSGKTPETLSALFLKFPLRVRQGSPKPYNSRHFKPPKHFQNFSPSVGHGTPSSTEGIFLSCCCLLLSGFLVLGAAGARLPRFVAGTSDCVELWSLRANSWISCPQLPCHQCKNGTQSTSFCNTRGHTPILLCCLVDDLLACSCLIRVFEAFKASQISSWTEFLRYEILQYSGERLHYTLNSKT